MSQNEKTLGPFKKTLGPLMLDLEGTQLSAAEAELLCEPGVGGVILFARNFSGRTQVEALIADIRAVAPHLLLAVDQEGGRVQRFREGFTRIPSMQRLADSVRDQGEAGQQLLADCGYLLAAEVLSTGLDFSFAPVLDLDRDHCAVIADRSFGDEPIWATEAARAFIAGMKEAGMAVTGKHFPGHGGVREDSHLEVPCDSRSLEQLREHDLIPFTALADVLDAVMPAHILFPEVDSRTVGFSHRWLQQILRGEMTFRGVIFSDDLSMKGADLAGTYAQKAAQALEAGCDMVLVCNHRDGALEVLDWLRQQASPPNPRLAQMRRRRIWTAAELEADPRIVRARASIATL